MSVPTPDDSFVFVNLEDDTKAGNSSNILTAMEVEPRPPEMKSMHVVSNVRNRYARTIVTSKYNNPELSAQQATFSIVLPDTAFIAGFVMEIKGKKYEAYVREKEEAKQEYQAAVSRGQAAAHVAVSARDSNKFTVSVNVEPQSDVTFTLTYEELLVRKHSKYELLVNLHLAQLLEDLGVDIHINESRPIINIETPALRSGNEITEKVTNNKYATITKNSNGIVDISFRPTSQQQKEMTNALSNEGNSNGISGQFVVEYDVERDPLGGEVLVNDGYFVHFFAPTELKPIPKHIVFVLDVSTSMHGRKIEQLKEAMKVILNELNPEDYFSIVQFANDVQILYSNNSLQEVANASLPATVENIDRAQKVVHRMEPHGCTNIYDALITALSLTLKGISTPGKNTKIQPIIVFLTDGQANVGESDPNRIIDAVEKRNDCENNSAIFTLAFGNDANKEFLKELAMKNSGFLRNIYEAADASLQLQDFYKQISSPLLTNVNFKYSEEVKEVTKHKFDILFNGSEFVVTGKVDKVVDGFVIVEGSTLYGIDDFRPTIIPICPTKENYGNLERLWAYMTIKQLLDRKYEKKYTSNSETPEQQALKLSLKYSFVTPLTSLVVVKPEETKEDDLQWGSVHVASRDLPLPSNVIRRQYKRLRGGGGDSFAAMQARQQQGHAGCSTLNLQSRKLFLSEIWDLSDPQDGTAQSIADSTQAMQAQQHRGHRRRHATSSSEEFQPRKLSRDHFVSQDRRNERWQSLCHKKPKVTTCHLEDDTDLINLFSRSRGLKNMHVVTNVKNNYARTAVTSKCVNQEMRALQATFIIVLPDTAFVVGFALKIKGVIYEANKRNKEQAEKEFQEAVTQGLAAGHVTSNADNSKVTVSVNIEAQSEVTFILTYEQFLTQRNNKYEIVTNLHTGHNIHVDVNIDDTKSIANVETPVLRSKSQIIKSQCVTVNKNKDNSIHVSFKPTVDQQKEIMDILKESDVNNGISGQFVVEYKTETSGEGTEISVNDVPVAAQVTDLVVVKSN